MPKYHLDLRIQGTADDSGVVIEQIEEVPPSRFRRFLSWFWELDMKAKLFLLAILGAAGYASHQVYVTGDWHMFYLSLKPLSDRVIEIAQGLLTG